MSQKSNVAYGTLEDHLSLKGGATAPDGGGHDVFSYLVLGGVVGLICYLVFHNKQKVGTGSTR